MNGLDRIDEKKRVLFVKPTGKFDRLATGGEEEQRPSGSGTMTGSEVCSFYGSLLEEESEKKEAPKKRRKKATAPEPAKAVTVKVEVKEEPQEPQPPKPVNERAQNHFLRAASLGDEKEMRRIMQEEDIDLNGVDFYGWSALMCAAAEGHAEVCKWMVELGCDWTVVNAAGQSVFDVARKRPECVEAILDAIEELDRPIILDSVVPAPPKVCEQCACEYRETTEQHETRTSHLLRGEYGTVKVNSFGLPCWNAGYRLMKRSGWDEETGLGRDGQGKKYPIRTVLKRDRLGLGSKTAPARVTHFDPHDERAVRGPERKGKREVIAEREKQLRREKRLEIDFRNGFK